ncbi:hypothetical protein MDAP_002820 [Mitosporidium daphniae]
MFFPILGLALVLLFEFANSNNLQGRKLEELFFKILQQQPRIPYIPERVGYIPSVDTQGYYGQGPFQKTNDHIYKCVNPGSVALTFDDGPSSFTEAYLDFLKTQNVKGTFFVIGINIRSSYESHLLKRMISEGHTVGSHSWSHPSLPSLSKGEILKEIVRTEKAIYSSIGKVPALFRPPYGEYDERVNHILKKRGYKSILWNLDTKDWSVRFYDPSLILSEYKNVLSQADPHSTSWIALQHDSYDASLRYLRRIIRNIRKNGFRVVDMAECLGVDPSSLYHDYWDNYPNSEMYFNNKDVEMQSFDQKKINRDPHFNIGYPHLDTGYSPQLQANRKKRSIGNSSKKISSQLDSLSKHSIHSKEQDTDPESKSKKVNHIGLEHKNMGFEPINGNYSTQIKKEVVTLNSFSRK